MDGEKNNSQNEEGREIAQRHTAKGTGQFQAAGSAERSHDAGSVGQNSSSVEAGILPVEAENEKSLAAELQDADGETKHESAEGNQADKGRAQEQAAEEIKQWFVMGAPYRNEIKVRDALFEYGVECYVPMCTRIREIKGRKVRKVEPAVSNLLFVRASEVQLKTLKLRIPRLQYKTNREDNKLRKVIVRDSEMENFMRFTRSLSEGVSYLTPEELKLEKGTRIRVVGGGLDGVEGTFLKLKGRRSKVLVVSLEGVVSAVVDISPEYVQVID